jgi:outer membrane protein assembly factor BamB
MNQPSGTAARACICHAACQACLRGVLAAVLAAFYNLLFATTLSAGEWPQILGPRRNGIAEDESLAGSWPASGPKLLWQRRVGEGLAGLAVAGGQAILFHRVGDEEIVEAMDPQTGKVRWKAAFPTSFRGSVIQDNGPRCVPLIHKDRVIVYGASRGLHCLNLADGTLLWSRDLLADYTDPREEGYFGAGSTPLVEGGLVLLNLGAARAHAGLAAFDIETGRTVWTSTDEQASYSSPVAATLGGRRQVVFVTRLSVLGVNPADGSVLWQFPFGKLGPTVNAANPLVLDGHVFVTASYGVGAVYARVDRQVQVVWEGEQLSSQYTTCVARDGVLYGIDGREDVGAARLVALDPVQGKLLWSQPAFGKATLILVGDKLLILKTDGTLVLAAAQPEGYRELARATILSKGTYALPALAGGRLYARDGTTLKCLSLP